MCCFVLVTMTAAVQTAGGGEEEEGERLEEVEGGSRDTVTCKRTHMVLQQRRADHRDSPNLLHSFKLHCSFKKRFPIYFLFFSSRILPPPAAHCRSDLGR